MRAQRPAEIGYRRQVAEPASSESPDAASPWPGRLLVLGLFVGIGGLGLWLDCRNESNAREHVRKGMGCILGTRPLPRDQVRARIDSIARGMAARGEAKWPRACATYFHRAAGDAEGAWAGRLAGAERVIERGDLDEIAATMQALYADEDFASPP